MEDRNLLADQELQARWRTIVTDTEASEKSAFRTFKDKLGREFSIYIGRETKDAADADEHDLEALAKGLDQLVYFGAINDADGLCHGLFGLYAGEDSEEVMERALEVDMQQRRLRIGAHLYWAAMAFVDEAGKRYVPTRRDSVAGQLFARGIAQQASPYAQGKAS
jgi:hypothetical protein